MGFRNYEYISIWKFMENSTGRSGTINITISKKNDKGEYTNEFSASVMVAGTAFNQMKAKQVPESKPIRARIINSDVTGGLWDKEKQTSSPYRFVIFALAFEDEDAFSAKVPRLDASSGGKSKATSKTKAKDKVKEDNVDDSDSEEFEF